MELLGGSGCCDQERGGTANDGITLAACILLRYLPKQIHINVQSEGQFLSYLRKDRMPSIPASFSQLVGILGSTVGPIKKTKKGRRENKG